MAITTPSFNLASAKGHLTSASKQVTKARIFVVVTLIFTWWFASVLPVYTHSFQRRVYQARLKIPSIKVGWNDSAIEDPRDRFSQMKLALIIEPRPLPHLVPQLLHMIAVVPPDWRFLFIGSEKSVISVGRAYATKHQQVVGKLDLMVLPSPWEIDSKEKVYRLLTDMRFYDEFLPGIEWILKFESDSILCANSGSSLNEWLDWSWAGAPRSADDRFSGNGGLSLRRVSAIKRILEFQERYNNTEPEDEWFGKRLWVLPGAKVAEGMEGVLAVENVPMDKPMGYHIRDGGSQLKDELWGNATLRKQIFDYCPELSLIMDMKLERERCGTPEEEAKKKKDEEDKKKKEEEEKKKKEEEAKKKAEEEEKKKKEEEERKKKQAEEEDIE